MEPDNSGKPEPGKRDIRLVGWGHYDYDREHALKKKGLPPEQIDAYDVATPGELLLMERMVIDEIVAKDYCFSGEAHQYALTGTPIFEIDGKRVYFLSSWRGWGGIMAEARTIADGKQAYDYMDFYMDGFASDEKPRLPPLETGVGIVLD